MYVGVRVCFRGRRGEKKKKIKISKKKVEEEEGQSDCSQEG